MYLKSLELEGFKSFVDRTKIDFNHGFTAVVGPNGCGKSNVSDAIRWVIGEQSGKNLRSKGVEDLIFNGTESRKPVNRAEISLTLADVPPGIRIANIPNISEEVTITRCCHRTGESEFYINQVPCRLKDITDFLLDIGISPKVLTVIEQGHIQDVITAKPEERRILIEEAAGILKFKQRKQEALRKLDHSRHNLERITDIVQELARRVESLKRQAAKAERYKKYQAEIKSLSLQLFSKKIKRFKQNLEVIEEEYRRQTEQKTEWAAQASILENQGAELQIEIDEALSQLKEQGERIHELTAQIAAEEHEIKLKLTHIAQADADIETADREIFRMNGEIKNFAAELDSQRVELGQFASRIDAQEETLAQAAAGLNQDRDTLRQNEENVQTGEKRVFAIYERLARKKNDLTAIKTRKQFLKKSDDSLQTEQSGALSETRQCRQKIEKAETDHQNKLRQLELFREEREAIRRQVQAASDRLKAQTDAVGQRKEKALTRSSLLSSLNELKKQFEGFNEGAKSLMTENGNGGRLGGLREVLVDVLKTPAEFEIAIETALGEKLQSIIVNSYSDTIEAVNYLKSHESGRSSFIPLNPKGVPFSPLYLNGNPRILGKALDFIECQEEYRPVIEFMLTNVVVTEDLESALNLYQDPKFQGAVVTRNGEMIDSQGLVTGGSRQVDSAGLLARNREIEELTGEVNRLQGELAQAQQELEEAKNLLEGLEQNLRNTESSVHQTEIAKTTSQKDLEQLQAEANRLEQKHATLDYERSSGFHELNELGNQRESIQAEAEEEEEEKSREEKRLAQLRVDEERLRKDLEEKSSEISGVKVMIASLKGKRDNTVTDIQRLGLQQENLNQQIQKMESGKQEDAAKIAHGRQEIENLEKRILLKAREKDEMSRDLVLREETQLQKTERLKEVERQGKALSHNVQQIMEVISRTEVQRSETKLQIAHLEERAYDDFNVTLQELEIVEEESFDEQEYEERVHELKGKVSRMGEVNLAAVSDFQQTNERHVFLSRQQEDLSESIQLLITTIDKIDRTTKKRFLDTFEAVNEKFKATFARLFQGGKANLTLTDASDPLDSGIEITANPIGKHMQRLTLLSGGEKTMTAIALMFAVFQVRPSPFCLLDEVDAPLDEANVIRFQEMLQEMVGDTQFILITHNQKTMSFASILYGITMEERGVSKVVSVNLA